MVCWAIKSWNMRVVCKFVAYSMHRTAGKIQSTGKQICSNISVYNSTPFYRSGKIKYALLCWWWTQGLYLFHCIHLEHPQIPFLLDILIDTNFISTLGLVHRTSLGSIPTNSLRHLWPGSAIKASTRLVDLSNNVMAISYVSWFQHLMLILLQTDHGCTITSWKNVCYNTSAVCNLTYGKQNGDHDA